MSAVISADGIGYDIGSGGTVTQTTSKATSVTLNKATGSVVTSNSALAAGVATAFSLNNSVVEANDIVIFNHTILTNYTIKARCTAGVITFLIKNDTAGSLSDVLTINFAIIKGATS